MDIVYRLGRASASEVQAELTGEPAYSTVRTHLRILEEKGMLRHEAEGTKYVFFPTVPLKRASNSALRHLLNTFFEGSAERMVAALLDAKSKHLTPGELSRIAKLIEDARK
jgi:predicted transcriptional regulator